MTPLTMWRAELIHPFVVHFPIAFLLAASLCGVLRLVFRSNDLLDRFLKVFLVTGTAGVWAAVWSGEIGHSTVNRVICDPTVTHAHEEWGWYAAYLATAALVFVFSESRLNGRARSAVLTVSSLLLLSIGVVLPYASHLGATLVYQQGAAVYRPTDDCREFAE